MLVVDLLGSLSSRVDPSRVVMQVRKAGHLPLIKPYLQQTQEVNEAAVNEALNELYIEEEDYEALRDSIENFDNFDAMELALTCERHELLEFRRVAALLYRNHGRWQQSIDLSKADNLYKDAMQTTADSGDASCAEDLIRFFVETGKYECFAACLFTCYSLLKPDLVLELAWRNRIMDFAMPYMVQVLKEYTGKVEYLKVLTAELEEKEAELAAQQQPAIIGNDMMAPPMLTYGGNGPGMAGTPNNMGMSPGGNYYIST